MNPPKPAQDGSVARLCPACGLCCNGVLFADVKLHAADPSGRLAALGLELRRTAGKTAFPQPCSCLDGSLCRIYAERPSRCRAFACGALLRVQSGALSEAAALRLITQVQEQVRTVRQHLARLGNAENHLPLNRRCAQVMAEPIELGGDPDLIKARARLITDWDRLVKRLHKEFLSPRP